MLFSFPTEAILGTQELLGLCRHTETHSVEGEDSFKSPWLEFSVLCCFCQIWVYDSPQKVAKEK